eukprot:CAMPEP_0197653438 /NCGR_PEP_ID=MMETSP1338-20131121/35504_1 /TAXON_ID=43686 ORGANISM="Pelagodinium beii, Strain RCC1491" /NCGR_SAMPLE_ID=MMETSP1338 /ASSEMBLY_ACC=CAM_ASM_000754 /LENGTH=96 /DNA_ID=CAMNT_0043228549 /DNA_START=42 /DNA_END=332 /DNA_ORIENTATION=+
MVQGVTSLLALRPSTKAVRGFCAVSTEVAAKKAKPKAPLGSRFRSFVTGFTVAGTLSGYALYYKVQWANEELSAMVREAAARQAQIERRLSALEGR